MVNPYRGEVALVVDGQRRVMRLSLGALVELETALESGSLVDLVERFEAGRYRAADVLALLTAGLRGGGWEGGIHELAQAEIEGGPVAAAQAGATLLARAFAVPE